MNNHICARPTCNRRTQNTARKYLQGLCDTHAKAAGLLHHWIDPDKALDELHRLHVGLWTNKHIAQEAGIDANTITNISRGKVTKIRQSTLKALRELPTESPYRKPAWPIERRIQSLRGAGYIPEEIAEACEVTVSTVNGIQWGRREWVPADLDKKIRDFFDTHKYDIPRPVSLQISLQRLPLPAQWENIDNPFEPWPKGKDPNGKKGDGSRQVGATAMFYENFDFVLREIRNQNHVLTLLKINISTLKAWKARTSNTVTFNQYQRVNNQAKRLRNNPQASQKEAA